jgi:hypothetical protein
MTYRPSELEQRIAWTRFRLQTDKDVLTAIARWFCWRPDGTARAFTVTDLARKAGVPKRSTERALERLEADWWLEIVSRRHRQPTIYRIVVHRLATADPDALTAIPSPPEWRTKRELVRQSGGQDESGGQGSLNDFEKVADQSTEEEVRTDLCTPTPDRTVVRHSGGQTSGRPEHPDVGAFLEWARVTYPQHAKGAHLDLEGDRRRYVVHRLLEYYGRPRLEQMAVLCWTIEADGDPESHATWIATGDRSLYVLKHKAAFLERVVVGAQQLSFGPMVKLSAREIEEAKNFHVRAWGGRCQHESKHEDWKDCVRAIALARHVS